MGEEEGQLESAVSPFWSRIQTREREIIGLHSTWWVDQCRVGVIALAILQISPLQVGRKKLGSGRWPSWHAMSILFVHSDRILERCRGDAADGAYSDYTL
ncbi:hypothetical protein EV126DRAFT_407585 [Verticillium dahliae]|nr:hypothetical protein EV126DRAFT_407585 [Verticillium dahliae]